MRAIFISYRRDDAEGEAGRLFGDLVARFGESHVFMDVTGIAPGRDFRKVIDRNVGSCGVLLALIGKSWLDAKDDTGRRRLDDPMDFVRLETASALKRDIPVVPVLVRGASIPRADLLPEDIRDLAYRNAVELTHARWRSDVQALIEAIRPDIAEEEPTISATPSDASNVSSPGEALSKKSRPWKLAAVAVVGAVALGAVVVATYEYRQAQEATAAKAAAREAAEKEAAAMQAASTKEAVAKEAAPKEAPKREAGGRGPAASKMTPVLPPSIPTETQPTPPTETQPTPPMPNIAGVWRDNWGTVYQLTQDGNAFQYTAAGTSCTGAYVQSFGSGGIRGNSVWSSYQSSLPSRGKCSGTLSSNGQELTSTCADLVCGTFVSTAVRQ